MDRLSELAFKAYRGLVYETDGFVEYFWASTVINEIATLNIGSRPASRKGSKSTTRGCPGTIRNTSNSCTSACSGAASCGATVSA